MPPPQTSRKTSCKKKTLEPCWEEVLAFSCVPGKSRIKVEMFDQVRGNALTV